MRGEREYVKASEFYAAVKKWYSSKFTEKKYVNVRGQSVDDAEDMYEDFFQL